MDLDGDGGFRVQRLLFEHSMQVPLLLAATLSADSVDPRQFLKVGTDGKRRVAGATKVPYILRSEFHQITETWQPKLNWENALMAALCTNMPYAILAVNPDLEKIGSENWPSPIPDFNPHTSKEDIRLPLPELVAYLFLQLSSRKLASTYRQTADSKWPEEGPSRMNTPWGEHEGPGLERKRSQPLSSSALKATAIQDIHREMTLITENVEAILLLIAECYGEDSKAEDLKIPKEYLDHLLFLLSAGSDEKGRPLPLHTEFAEWKRDPNARLSLKEVAKAIIRSLKMQREDDLSAKISEVKNLEKKTLLRSGTPSNPLHGRDVRVVGCCDSYIYLLNAMNRLSVIGCMDCTIFVGSSTSLSIIGCGRVKVIATTRNCRVSNCVDTLLFLCTNQMPLVLGDTRAIVFAPYNASYENFERDAAAVGVDPKDNRWNEYYAPLTSTFGNVTSNASGSTAHPATSSQIPASVVSILPPEKFFPFVVPVAKEDGPKPSSGVTPAPQAAPLPAEYSAIIKKRTAEVDSLRKAVRTAQAKFSSEGSTRNGQGPDLQSVVQEYFREWLISSGNLRQINDLMRLEEEFNGSAS